MQARLHAYVSSQVRQIGASRPASKWSTSRGTGSGAQRHARVLHDHARARERLQRPAVDGQLLLGHSGAAARRERRRLLVERAHDIQQLPALQKREAPGAEVVRERTERLRADRDLAVQAPRRARARTASRAQYTPHMPSIETSSTRSSDSISSSSVRSRSAGCSSASACACDGAGTVLWSGSSCRHISSLSLRTRIYRCSSPETTARC